MASCLFQYQSFDLFPFSHLVQCGYIFLDNEGKRIFFERMFRTTLTPEERDVLDRIPNLAPGDFRTVRQALYYLDDDSNTRRLESLKKESAVKNMTFQNTPSGKIGF